jgi:phage baseplate assembly protein V
MKGLQALPGLKVEVEGSPLGARELATLEEVVVRQALSLPAQCELTFRVQTDREGPGTALRPGRPLRLRVADQDVPLFTGEITALEHEYRPEGGRRLRARGYDLLHRLRKSQPVRAHLEVTPKDLASELVAPLGLSAEADEPGPLYDRLLQHRENDLDFLVLTAQRAGLYLTLRESTLHLVTLQGLGDPVRLSLGDSLLEARLEVNGDFSLRSVKSAGWDPWRVEVHQGRAQTARVGREVSVELSPGEVGGTGERVLSDELLGDDHQAEAVAQAELDRHAAGEVALFGVASGNALLRPAAPVEITGVDRAFEGRYILTRVVHRLDSSAGFTSEFSTDPPKPRFRARGPTGVLGNVKSVDDPQQLGRIQVSLPTIGELETGWLSVLTAGGGPGKGLLALPDVGDQVLVLLPQGDPVQGVVLGGVYGSKIAPPAPSVEGGRVKRFTFLTSGGLRITLDDEKDLLRLENSQGSLVELGPQAVRLHAEADLTLEAPGHAVVFKGQTVDFKRG